MQVVTCILELMKWLILFDQWVNNSQILLQKNNFTLEKIFKCHNSQQTSFLLKTMKTLQIRKILNGFVCCWSTLLAHCPLNAFTLIVFLLMLSFHGSHFYALFSKSDYLLFYLN